MIEALHAFRAASSDCPRAARHAARTLLVLPRNTSRQLPLIPPRQRQAHGQVTAHQTRDAGDELVKVAAERRDRGVAEAARAHLGLVRGPVLLVEAQLR